MVDCLGDRKLHLFLRLVDLPLSLSFTSLDKTPQTDGNTSLKMDLLYSCIFHAKSLWHDSPTKSSFQTINTLPLTGLYSNLPVLCAFLGHPNVTIGNL